MLIHDPERSESVDGLTRVSVHLTWEASERRDSNLWFESTHRFAGDDLMDAFLTAAAPLAMLLGERRIAVEHPVSSDVIDRLNEAQVRIASFSGLRAPVLHAPTHRSRDVVEVANQRSMAFFSGGVDSLAMVRERFLAHPPQTPFATGLLLFGLNSYDFADGRVDPARLAAHEDHARRLGPLAAECGLALVRMSTNVRSLYPDFESWAGVGSASALAASALAGAEWSEGWLASDGQLVGNSPFMRKIVGQLGVFPLLSNARVQLRVGQPSMRRLDKIRLLADWPAALAAMRPCLNIEVPGDGRINCGKCEKCLRTMLALLALGVLDRTAAFEADDVTIRELKNLDLGAGRIAGFVEVLEPLRAAGREDLTSVLERLIRGGAPAPAPSLWQRLREKLDGSATR
ncbi:MAG: hypothetical protein ACT4OZ_08070 [Gemmatimonadota bacterium]